METERSVVDDSATSVSVNYCIDLSRQFQQAIERKKEGMQQKKGQQQQQQQQSQQPDVPTACSHRVTKVIMQPCELKLPIRLETWLAEDGTLIVRPRIEPSVVESHSTSSVAQKGDTVVPKPTKLTTTTSTNSNTADGDVYADVDEEETPVCDCSAAQTSAAVVCQCRCCQNRHSEEVLFDQVGACLPAASKVSGKSSREGKRQNMASATSSSRDWGQQQDGQTKLFGESPCQQQLQHHRRNYQHHHHHRQQMQAHLQTQHRSSRDRTFHDIEPRMQRGAVKKSANIDPLGVSSCGRVSEEDNYDDDQDQSSADTPVGDSHLYSSSGRPW